MCVHGPTCAQSCLISAVVVFVISIFQMGQVRLFSVKRGVCSGQEPWLVSCVLAMPSSGLGPGNAPALTWLRPSWPHCEHHRVPSWGPRACPTLPWRRPGVQEGKAGGLGGKARGLGEVMFLRREKEEGFSCSIKRLPDLDFAEEDKSVERNRRREGGHGRHSGLEVR